MIIENEKYYSKDIENLFAEAEKEKSYGKELDGLFAEADKEVEALRQLERDAEQTAEYEQTVLAELAEASRKPMYDAMRHVVVRLKTGYEMGNCPGFRDYRKMARDICKKHFDNYFES